MSERPGRHVREDRQEFHSGELAPRPRVWQDTRYRGGRASLDVEQASEELIAAPDDSELLDPCTGLLPETLGRALDPYATRVIDCCQYESACV
jgi:hypothetical protein